MPDPIIPSEVPAKSTERKDMSTITKIVIVIAIIIVSCKGGWEWAVWDFNNARPFIEAMAYDKGYKDGYHAGTKGLPPAR